MRLAYVDTPEFLDGVESDNFLQEIIPVITLQSNQLHYCIVIGNWTDLSTWWLGEPQSPLVHEGMLDVEVVLVVEDSDLLLILVAVLGAIICLVAIW